MRIIIATIKEWNIRRAVRLQERYRQHEIRLITQKEEFTYDNMCNFKPDYIFLPHWSYYIPDKITSEWECVVFHMTDLPYGRGGSPLQNLIVRGHRETKVSAIRVTAAFDEGPVYMKRPLSLDGSATEIFERCADVVFNEMLPCFLEEAPGGRPQASPQVGEPVIFKRRKPEESEITPDMDIDKIYDYIRMLDAEGYPRAFIDYGGYRLCFEAASLDEAGNTLAARVVFRKREEEDV